MTKKITETNEFGETHTQSQSDSQALAYVNALPAKAGVAAIVAISTPNASDPATVITLANANKAKINEILAALKVVS